MDKNTVSFSGFAPRKKGVLNFIGDQIEWAKTKRGGKEDRDDVNDVPSGCQSSYGLCE